MTRLIDTHFHLDHYKNHAELYRQINELGQYTLCMTNSPGIYVSCKRLYPETNYLKFASGFHPQEQSLSEKDFSDFMRIASSVAYIGEVGLDFSSKYVGTKEKQLKQFEKIVKFCASSNKLLSVHLRNSENEAIEILSQYIPEKCIIHWFNGSDMQLKNLVTLGCYFSINASMIKSKAALYTLSIVPKDKILVESDGPYSKVHNKKFLPRMLAEEYQLIENYLNIDNLLEQVYGNFKELVIK